MAHKNTRNYLIAALLALSLLASINTAAATTPPHQKSFWGCIFKGQGRVLVPGKCSYTGCTPAHWICQ